MQTFKYLSYRDLFQIIIDLSISAILIHKFVQLTLYLTLTTIRPYYVPTMSCLIVSYCTIPNLTIPNLTIPSLTLTCPTFPSLTLLTSPYLTLTCDTIPYLTLPYPIFIQHHLLQSTTLITLTCPICFSFSKVLDQMKNQWYHLLNMIRIVLRF